MPRKRRAATEADDSEAAPRLPDSEGAAWGGFLRAQHKLVTRLDAELRAQHGMSLSEYEVLLLLAWATDHARPMSELARWVLMTPSGLTRTVDRLEKAGLVRRRPSQKDKRVTLAVLSSAGLERFRPAHKTHQEGIRRYFLAHCPPALQKRLAAFWSRINSHLEP